MQDIPMKRIIRYSLAVFICLFFVANVLSNEARAETGSITVTQLTDVQSSLSVQSGNAAVNFTTIYWKQGTYTSISWFRINDTGGIYTLANSSMSSHFSIVKNGSGGGWAYYNNGTGPGQNENITWVFETHANMTGSPIELSYDDASFVNSISWTSNKNDLAPSAVLLDARPVVVCACGGVAPPKALPGINFAEMYTTATDYYNITYPVFDNVQYFNLNVTKNGTINTKHNITNYLGNVTVMKETTFNTNNYTLFQQYPAGLVMNVSISTGEWSRIVLNTTGSDVIVQEPGTGGSASGQISYSYNSAVIGQNYGINANISTSNFTAFTTFYIYAYDANDNLITGFPIDFSTQNYSTGRFWTFNNSGTYVASLKYCGILECFLGIRHTLDNASIYISPASYAFSVTTDAANYQPGNTINIVATNPSPNAAYLTAFGETGIITDIAWNTLIPAGQSVGLSKVVPQNMPEGTYLLNLATTQSYNPIVAQATFNISSPSNTSNTLSVLWGESLYLLGNVGTITTTSNYNASTLTVTSPGGHASSFVFPANSTNYTLITLDEVGSWKAKIVDNGNASNFTQSNTTVSAGNPTDNDTIAQCRNSVDYVCWDKKTYNQGQAYTISFQLKPKITDIASLNPYIEITNPSGTVIYNQSVNGSFDQSSGFYVGSLSGSFDPQASTGLYFARLKNRNLLGETEIRAEGAAEVIAGATPTTTEGQVSTTTATNLLNVLGMIAFYGLMVYVGLLYGLIKLMTRNGAPLNGSAFIYAAVILANIIALIGLFDPFKMYVLVLTWIIAGATFSVGRRAVSGAD